MSGYALSRAADQDFENIFEFGIDTFGLDQALSYQNGMKQRFDILAEQPQLYPPSIISALVTGAVFTAHIRFTIALMARVFLSRASSASKVSLALFHELPAPRIA